MKKFKKVLSAALALTMLVSLTACGGETKKDKTVTSTGNVNTDSTSFDERYKELLEECKGSTVVFATWESPDKNEAAQVLKDFESKYGIKVEIMRINESEYNQTIAGYIASDKAPDVYFAMNDFPGALNCLQPVSNGKLDLTDPIYDQDFIDMATIDGETYLVNTLGNIWSERDLVFYNKKLLTDNNITTPEEYYEAGNWTFETMKKVMSDVKALGSDYVGGYLDFESIIGSVGASYYDMQDGQFVNTMDTKLTDVNRYLAQCYKEGLVQGYGNYNYRDNFVGGKVGIAVTNAYGLKKAGFWRNMNTDDIGFTYIPDWSSTEKSVATGLFRGWGICKGAKNPVGAALFIRYYLDVNNYDTSSAFINEEAESFFFKLTGTSSVETKHSFLLGGQRITGEERVNYAKVCLSDPTQIETQMATLKNVVDNQVSQINEFISKQTK